MQPVYVLDGNEATIESLEGLYIVPKKPPAAIQGILLQDVVVVGTAVRGPVDVAVEVTDPARFAEVYGTRDYGGGGALISEMWKALVNRQWGRLWCIRAAAAAAATSSVNLAGPNAKCTGTITNDTQANMSDGDTVTLAAKDNLGVLHTIVFEFRKTGSASGGHIKVDISTDTTAAQVAARLNTAILAQIAALTLEISSVVDGSNAAILDLASLIPGTIYSFTLAKSSSSALAVSVTAGTDGTIATLAASSPGAWSAGLLSYAITAPDDGITGHFNLVITYLGATVKYASLDLTTGHNNIATVIPDDPGTLIVLTKLADGTSLAPAINLTSSTPLTGGTDGSIADSDFTGTDRALDAAEAIENNVTARFVAGRSNSVIKADIKTRAARTNKGFWLTCPDDATITPSAAEAEAQSLQVPNGMLVYCFNHTKTLDPIAASFMTVEPHSWMASVLSQTDVDRNPGDEDAKLYLAAVNDVIWKLKRQILIDMKAAGVAAIIMDNGATFWSGITADLEEIADVREVQWLDESIGNFLVHSEKKPNTKNRRRMMVAAITDFLDEQVRNEHVVEDFNVDNVSVNTPTTRGRNVEKVLVEGRLISHMNFLVLETEFGTTVQIAKSA